MAEVRSQNRQQANGMSATWADLTPVEGAMLVRTDRHLYRFEAEPE